MGSIELSGLFEMEILPLVRIDGQNQSIQGCQPKRVVSQRTLSISQSVFRTLSAVRVTILPDITVMLVALYGKLEVRCEVSGVLILQDFDWHEKAGGDFCRVEVTC